MKKTELRRKTPLKPAGWLRRKVARITGVKKRQPTSKIGLLLFCDVRGINPKQKKSQFVYGPYHKWIKKHPCILANDPRHKCQGRIEGHHVKHVGNGGEDYANEVPACTGAHTGSKSVHVMGKRTFEKYWGVDLQRTANEYAAKYASKPRAA